MKDGKKLLAYFKAKKWRIKALNIAYLEDADADNWMPHQNPKLNVWDDVRIVFTDDGEVLLSCVATTEPGDYYTFKPMNKAGAARIAFGQYLDAWVLGYHFKQYALVQVGNISVHRDLNKDGKRTSDKVYSGLFGVNQHTTGNSATSSPPALIGKWSAGCLVGKNPATHYNQFMPLLKHSGVKTFDTAIIDGGDFHNFK